MALPAFLHPFARPAAESSTFLSIVRGEGAAVFDADGRRYVDALAGLWFCHVGHGRTEITDAIADQLHTLDTFQCFERFTNEPADALAERLAGLAPITDSRIFFTDSGSEAVDTALKLVRLSFALQGRPERHLVVGRRHAYHGVTYGGLSVMGLPANTEGWGPLVGGTHALGIEHDELSAARELFERRGSEIAAVIAEPVIAAGGVRPPPPGYLQGLRALCDEHGALLILDEVVTAFGRLGGWWGADVLDVRPDVITFAKGVTSGYLPLGGVVVGPAVRTPLEADPDFVLRTGHTYSGHPTVCRAGLANLDVIERDDLAGRAVGVLGPFFAQHLGALLADGLVAEVRGLAGIWAVDLHEGVSPVAVRDQMMEHGVIVRPIGTSTLAMCPPLVIGDDDLALITEALRACIPPR